MGLDLLQAIATGGPGAVLATIIDVQGSSPRHPGAKLLAGGAAGPLGTVGGGRGEALALEAARRCREAGASALIKVEMVGQEVTGQAMVCGGVNTMLIECLADLAPYRAAWDRLQRGEPVVLAKRLAGTAPGPVTVATALADAAGRPILGELDPAAQAGAVQALERGEARFDPASGWFFDPLTPQEKLLILGAGHVGRALAELAPALGFAVTLVDDRPEFLDSDRLPPGVRTVLAGFEPAIAEFPFDPATYAVVVTRGHQSDLQCVRAVLRRRYRYAGLMGSARKVRLILDQVRQEGFDPDQVAALCCPIGLDIGAETPAELAVAILGELIAVRRRAAILPALQREREARRG